MLSRLLKYEFRASARIFGIVYLAIAGLCLSAGILTRLSSTGEGPGTMVQGFATTLSVIAMLFLFAAVVITTVVNLRRFYVGVFRDEGYLLHTLPVSTTEVLASKLIPALVWTVATVAVMSLSILLAAMIAFRLPLLKEMLESLAQLSPAKWGTLVLGLLVGLGELTSTILRIYAVIALGQTSAKHRIASAVLYWFGLNLVQSWLGLLVGESLFSHIMEVFTTSFMEPESTPSMLLMLGISLFWSALYWAVTHWVLAKKLDLE